jgi:ABC-type uncharacterized transport system permease subunit
MSKNKKKNKTRAFEEAKKAQAAVDRSVYIAPTNDSITTQSNTQKSSKNLELPIKEIKSDLIKNIAFAIASVVVLIVLEKTKFGYLQLLNIFKI